MIISLLLWQSLAAHAANTPCAEKTYAGEKKIDARDYAGARTILAEAAKLCTKESSARPYVAYGKALFELRNYNEAIKQFEIALTKQPGLPLANMDIGASYMELGDFAKSIEYSKKAAESKDADKKMLMQANYNVGLAHIKQAAATNNTTDRSGEPYFKKSMSFDPSFGGNYFYLGVYKESAENDFKGAAALYKQGCDRHYQQSCEFLGRVAQAGASQSAPQAATPPAGGKIALSPENKATLDKIEAAYKKKYDLNTSTSIVGNLRNSCTQIPQSQCKVMLENVLTAAK